MESLEEKCLAFFGATRGQFHTTKKMADTLQVDVKEVRATLVSLYRMCLTDRMVLIQGDSMTGFYGHREGIEPGTALINNTTEGKAA